MEARIRSLILELKQPDPFNESAKSFWTFSQRPMERAVFAANKREVN